MKSQTIRLPTEKCTTSEISRRIFLIIFSLVLLTAVPLWLIREPRSYPKAHINSSGSQHRLDKACHVFSGKWITYSKGPMYSNETCSFIIDQQNCLKNGRPDRDYLNWRWKPDECELPLFDAVQFLEIVRGKSMAFVGDSVGINQMQSLLCLLASVAYPKDITQKYTPDTYSSRWFYADYNFTLASFWAPFLVRARDADPDGHSYTSLMNLYLDEADKGWISQIENFDYVIISAGHWFFRPNVFYEKGQIVGCYMCGWQNTTDLTKYYGYRRAFRTAFHTLLNLKGYRGITFLRTFSPSHFENGNWDDGGNCLRMRPFTKEDVRMEGYNLEFYLTQVEELKAAKRDGIERGLHFMSLDTTEIMLLRPDGHPNSYGRSINKKVKVNDCVHWCTPGPIDTWNEFLFYLMKMEKLQLI